jgi:hypothetical protein
MPFSVFLKPMKRKNKWIFIGSMVFVAITIHLFSADSARVEQYYSQGVYPFVSKFLRYLFGWLPFSIGDFFYGSVILWLIVKLVKITKMAARRKLSVPYVITILQKAVISMLLIYIIFNVFWGINYNRKGISAQLGLKLSKYSVVELKDLNDILLKKANASKTVLLGNPSDLKRNKDVFNKAQVAYIELNKQYAFLNYQPASIKSSIWGWAGNYLGFMGYYNPFTGEGQVNTTIPKFLQPYTSCHEVAHQLGYAKENEANFVGYLAASSSKDPAFQYSVYLDLFLYANRNLYFADSAAARTYANELLPGIKEDLKEWRRFNERHKNPIEPIIRWGYGIYLENNQQPSGMLSYDEVTGFLIAYQKKFGKM